MSSLNRQLNQFFDSKVKMGVSETSQAAQSVYELVLRILEEVHRLDKRFMKEPVPTGSYYQGLKVGKPDEFDFSVKLDVVPNWNWNGTNEKGRMDILSFVSCVSQINNRWNWYYKAISEPYHIIFIQDRRYGFDKGNIPDPLVTARDDLKIIKKPVALYAQAPKGYVFLNVGELASRTSGHAAEAASSQGGQRGCVDSLEEWERRGIDNGGDACMTFDGDIIPFLVKRRLKKLVGKAVRDLKFDAKVKVEKKMHGPATTLKVKFKHISDQISVDLSPIIVTDEPVTVLNWPRGNTTWPPPSEVEQVKKQCINFVAKKNFVWTIDAVRCENELLYNIDDDGGCRKKSQRILKRLKEDWCPVHVKPILSSYCLKNVMYWECEVYPAREQWSTEKLGERVMSMAKNLCRWLMEKNVPWYFAPSVDILRLKKEHEEWEPVISGNIKSFLDNPMDYLAKH